MEVRRAQRSDADALAAFWAESTAELDFAPYPASPFDARLLEEHAALVAEEDGEPVGAVYLNLSTDHLAYVFGLYVVPHARGRGVGRGLMRAAAALAREAGKQYVLLNVDTPNERARALYARLGFEDAARQLRIETAKLLEG